MSEIKRIEIDEVWADSTVIEAGDFVFIGYCMKNEGQDIKAQIMGAIEVLEQRLEMVGLTLESVVKMDCLFKNIDDLNYLRKLQVQVGHPAVKRQRGFRQRRRCPGRLQTAPPASGSRAACVGVHSV
uniref:hypothetical protein n=1 Tax=Oscillibacter ruminantium TaxID=1263547 RepID=UPI00332182F3